MLKPSEKVPSTALWLARLWQEAGLPDSVFNVVNGAVDALLEHPDVAAVSFVGSTPVAAYVHETASRHGKRVQALVGAKNHMLVLPDAALDLTADQAVNAGFARADRQAAAPASAGAMARAHSSRAHWILPSATSGRSPNTSAARA